MAELADAQASGACGYCSREGSSPFSCSVFMKGAVIFYQIPLLYCLIYFYI